jgi:RNA polymerase sigma-70 factor (ECF subfamily)
MEAAVQSAHCHRLFTGQTPWKGIAELYRQINTHFPTQGSLVAGAVALGESGDLPNGLQQLDQMDPKITRTFQPWWVARAYILGQSGAPLRQLADQAYQTAIGLTTQTEVKRHLERMRQRLVAE